VIDHHKPRFVRSQRMTIVSAILAFVVLIAILQLWLFTATVNAVLGGDRSIAWPAREPRVLEPGSRPASLPLSAGVTDSG
jgi:hypothetical protein